LSHAVLEFANTSNVQLTGANLSDADLAGVKLSGADLIDADLSRAFLGCVNLSGANLSMDNLANATGEVLNLDKACGNAKTKLPNGLKVSPCSTDSRVDVCGGASADAVAKLRACLIGKNQKDRPARAGSLSAQVRFWA